MLALGSCLETVLERTSGTRVPRRVFIVSEVWRLQTADTDEPEVFRDWLATAAFNDRYGI
jgi:hypothetical protein